MKTFGALCIAASLFVIAQSEVTTTDSPTTNDSSSSTSDIETSTAKYDLSNKNLKELLTGVIANCTNAHKITPEQTKNLLNQGVPKTEIEKCFMVCVYNAFRIIDHDKYNEQGLKTLAMIKFGSSPDEFAKATQMIEVCAKEAVVKDPNEKCGLGRAIRECFVQAGSKVNFFPKI